MSRGTQASREQMASDSLNIFLCWALSYGESIEDRARKIRKCAKVIGSRTNDTEFKRALRTIRNDKRDDLVVIAVQNAVINYFR